MITFKSKKFPLQRGVLVYDDKHDQYGVKANGQFYFVAEAKLWDYDCYIGSECEFSIVNDKRVGRLVIDKVLEVYL